MLPFIQYLNDDKTVCMLAIANGADFSFANEINNPIIVGQRFLATYKLFVIVNWSENLITLSLGNGYSFYDMTYITWITILIMISVIFLSSIVIWLVYRRKK
jgi:hypothetical protein